MNTSTPLSAKFHVLCFSVLLGFGGTASAQLPGSSKIDNILSSSVSETGRTDLMIIKNGEVVYNRSFGGNQQAIVNKVEIASASKWLVAATLLKLADEGLLSLNDTVGRFLPRFRDDKAQITIRQLLSHTSGLPSTSSWLKDKNLSLAKSVDSIASRMSLAAEPGTQFIYGDVSYQVAARLAEMVTGKDWETLFKEKIAAPCKMVNTDFGNQRYKNAGSGAWSTVDDYSNFLLMILNRGTFQGVRVLSANSVHEMVSDQTAGLRSGYAPYKMSPAKPRFYGMGAWIERIMPVDNDATEISCQGEKGFTPWVNFCKHLAGVYSFNADLNKVTPVIGQTKAIIDLAFKDNCNDAPVERGKKDDDRSFTNPWDYQANISFTLEAEAMVTLKLFDPLGNEILTLVKSRMKAGEYSVPVDASALNPGMYFYRLNVNDKLETKKFTIR